MIVQCTDCDASYDDAERFTFCPHKRLMPAGDLKRKDAAFALLGRDVSFAHEPQGPFYRVESVDRIGMVTLATMAGNFGPHLFVLRP